MHIVNLMLRPFYKMKIIYIFLIILTNSSFANNLGVRAQSLGGAIRAEASSNDVIYFNPAGMLKYRRISTDVDYLHESSTKSSRIGASLVDSKTGQWAMGLSYNSLIRPQQKSSHMAYFSMAMPLVSDVFVFGASLSYIHDIKIGPDPYVNFFNVDLGLLANLPYGLAFSFSADHILKPKGNEKALGLSIGAAFDLGQIVSEAPLSLSFDWLMDDVKSDEDLEHVISAGLQYLMVDVIPLRFGFKSSFIDNTKIFSLGTGIESPFISIDGLYSQDIAVGKNRYFGAAVRVLL